MGKKDKVTNVQLGPEKFEPYNLHIIKVNCPCCGETVQFYAKDMEKSCPTCGTIVKS